MGEGGEMAIPTEVQQDTEAIGKGITLYKQNNLEIFVPRKQNIPQEEGIHIEVSDGSDSADTPKQVLRRFLFGLASAKVVAESSQTPQEPWANTRIEKDKIVSVYGRNAFNPSSWRKPVDTLNRKVLEKDTLAPGYDEKRLKTLFERYIPKWEKLASAMNLFPDQVTAQDVSNEDFKDYAVIWRSGTHTITIQKEPHLTGYHLVVHANEAMARQWQTVKESTKDVEEQKMVQKYIQATLEATAIAMGIQDLIAPKVGEIHNSGNWAEGLKTIDEGGALSLE
ncbi:MAG: hypothetical protein Q7S38_01840, partial [bacterium]|nr:hypothetical protein [bacterium]